MTKMKKSTVYILLILFGLLLSGAAYGMGVASRDIFLSIGSGIVTSTIVSYLINSKANRELEKSKKEIRDALLRKMSEQAESVLFTLLCRVNQFYEQIIPEEIAFPDGKGQFMLACLKAHEKSDVKNQVLAYKLEDIHDAYMQFWGFSLSVDEQPSIIKDLFYELFCRNNEFISDYVTGLGSITSDLLFAMGLITEKEKGLLPTFSEINTLKELKAPAKKLDELNVSEAQVLIDLLCCFCRKTYEGIWKIHNPNDIFKPVEQYAELNQKSASCISDELYYWPEGTTPKMIYKNLFAP